MQCKSTSGTLVASFFRLQKQYASKGVVQSKKAQVAAETAVFSALSHNT
jgi:hypothetical protein